MGSKKRVKLYSANDYLAVLEPQQNERVTEYITPSGQTDFGSTLRGEPYTEPERNTDHADTDLTKPKTGNALASIPMLASQFAGGMARVVGADKAASVIDESTAYWEKKATPASADIVKAIGQAPAAGLNMSYGGVGGIARALGDIQAENSSNEGLRQAGRNLSAAGKEMTDTSKMVAQEMEKDVASDSGNGWAGAVRGGLGSAYNNLMMMPLYLVAPEVPLAAMGIQSGGQGYSDAREKGGGITSALVQGAGKGGMEVATEKLPFGQLVKLLKPEAKMSLGAMFKTIGKMQLGEYAGESINTLYTDIQDKMFENPNATMDQRIENVNKYFTSGEAARNWKETLKTTLVQTMAMSGGGALINRTQQPHDPATPVDLSIPPASTPDIDLTGNANTAAPATEKGSSERNDLAKALWSQRQSQHGIADQSAADVIQPEPEPVVAQPEPAMPTLEEYQQRYASAHDQIIELNDVISSGHMNDEEMKGVQAKLRLAKMREKASKDNIDRLVAMDQAQTDGDVNMQATEPIAAPAPVSVEEPAPISSGRINTANAMRTQKEVMQHGFPDEDHGHYDTLIHDAENIDKVNSQSDKVISAWDKQSESVKRMGGIDASKLAEKAGFNNTNMNGFQYAQSKHIVDQMRKAKNRDEILSENSKESLQLAIEAINFAYGEKWSTQGGAPTLADRITKWKDGRDALDLAKVEDQEEMPEPIKHARLPLEYKIELGPRLSRSNNGADKTPQLEARYIVKTVNTETGTAEGVIHKYKTLAEAVKGRDELASSDESSREVALKEDGITADFQKVIDEFQTLGDHNMSGGMSARLKNVLAGKLPALKVSDVEFAQKKLDEFKAKSKGPEKPQGRTLDLDGRATDGKPILPGERFITATGRQTFEYPRQKGEKYASQWLIDSAVAEADARGDEFNSRSFSNEKPLKRGDLTTASRDSMLMYLFDKAENQPKVIPSILKPLVKKTEAVEAPATSFDGLLRKAMANGVPLNKVQLISFIAEREGVKPAEIGRRIDAQELDWKGIEEEVESAAVNIAREIMSNGKSYSDRITDLERLYASQPNLGHRTGDSKALQQYSTPLPIAGIMAEAMEMDQADAVYEPTAGNGALLIGADPKTITANELDNRRNDSLKAQGFKTILNADAMEDITKVRDKSQDVVVMNPPFGTADNSIVVDGVELSKREHIIAANALDKMKNDGKASIIIGGHNFEKGKMTGADQAFLNWLYNHYNVSHNVEVDGKLYGRQGTTYPIRLITIEGRKAVPTDDFIPNQRIDKRAAEMGIGTETANTFDQIRAILKTERSTTDATGTSDRDADRTGTDTAGANRSGTVSGGVSGQSGSGSHSTGRSGQSGVLDGDGGRGNGESADLVEGESGSGGGTGSTGRDQHNGVRQGIRTVKKLLPEFEGVDPSLLQAMVDAGLDPYIEENVNTTKTETSQAQNPPPNLSDMNAGANAIADILADADFSLQSDDKQEAAWKKIQPIAGQILDGIVAKVDLLEADANEILDQFSKRLINTVKDALTAKGMAVADIVHRIGVFIQKLSKFTQDARANIEKLIANAKGGQVTHDLQAPYPQRSKGKSSGKLAPINLAPLMEQALQKLEDKVGNIDAYVQSKVGYETENDMFDALSGEQVDAVALAIDAIDNGSGVIIGDQTGVGKGRIASAIMVYARQLGHKPIFITEKPKLFSDINRDMVDVTDTHPDGVMKPFIVGNDPASNVSDDVTGDVVYKYDNGMKKPSSKTGKPIKMDQKARYLALTADPDTVLKDFDYVAITYDQLKGPDAVDRRAMIQKLAQGNIVIMDEAHNAAGESGVGAYIKGTILPSVKAGTYLSATYAKRPSALGLYSITELGRTGMSQLDLENAIISGGVPMQQIISGLLAESGQYIRRENDYTEMNQPTISMDISEKATKELEAKADATTEILRDILEFSKAFGTWIKTDVAGDINGNVTRKEDRAGVDSTNFASTVHNYTRQLTFALKVDQMVDEGIKALKAGEKPIFYIDNTMNAFLSNYATENELKTGDLIDANFSEVMRRGLGRLMQYTVKPPGVRKKADGVTHTVHPDELPPSLRYIYDLISEKIDGYNLDVPVSPIDALGSRIVKRAKAELGIDINVVEITGRNKTIDMSDEDRPVLAGRKYTNRNDIVNGFNGNGDGPKFDVLTFNQAGATGLSLHPTVKTGDKRPRHMFIVQPSLNIDSYMQALGRIFRTGQIHKPKYTNLILNLPTETRPAIVQNKKLASINANLAAKTEGVFTSENVPDMDNTYGDEVIDNYLAEHGDIADLVSMSSTGADDSDDGMFAKFSGRLALLPVAQQKAVWADLIADYNAFISYLDEMGENTLVAKDYDFQAKTLNTNIIIEESGTGVFQSSANLEEVEAKILKNQYPRVKVEAIIKEELGGKTPTDYAEEIKSEVDKEFEVFHQELESHLVQITGKESAEERLTKEEANVPVERKIALAEGAHLMMQRILSNMKVGQAFDIKLKQENVTGVVIGVKYTPGKAGSPVAPSKLSFKFAINEAVQTLTIPMSKLASLDTDNLGHGVPSDWDNSMNSRTTERRFITTGNLLRGMGKVKGHGQVVYYTNDKGVRHAGILMNQSRETRQFIDGLISRISVTADTLISAIENSNFGASDLIRPSTLNVNSIRYDESNSNWVMWVDPRAAAVMGDDGIKRLSVAGRFDRGRGNQASQMFARFYGRNIADVIRRLDQMAPGITFDMPRSFAPQADSQAASFSIAEKKETGVEMSKLKSVVSKMAKSFDVPVEIVETPADLPFNAPADAMGAYRDGKVYLVRSNIKDTESAVATVLAHEITHHGISRLGERGKQLLNQITIAHLKEIKEIMAKRGWEDTADTRIKAANELVAQHGETKLKPAFWQKVKDLIRDVVSKATGAPVGTELLDRVISEISALNNETSENNSFQETSDSGIFTKEETLRRLEDGLYCHDVIPRTASQAAVGSLIQATADVARGSLRSVRPADGREVASIANDEERRDAARGIRAAEAEALRTYAAENSLLIPNFASKLAENGNKGGTENYVYHDSKSDKWLKANFFTYSPTFSDLFDRMMIHNSEFPDEAYTLEGFADVKGEFLPVFSQRSIRESAPVNPRVKENAAAATLSHMGYQRVDHKLKLVSLASFVNGEGVVIKDINSRNLAYVNGEIAFIDPVISMDADTKRRRITDSLGDTDFSLRSDKGKSFLANAANKIRNMVQNVQWDTPSRLGPIYMQLRYLAKGSIESAGEKARKIHDRIAQFRNDEITNGQIYEYLVTKDADVNMITNPAAREVAKEAKNLIITMGRKLVDAGKMKQETLDKREGEYLPRLYLKHLLGEDVLDRMMISDGSGGKKLDQSYLKKRNDDIPEDVRKLILGEVKDPAYLVFMALARPARDLALDRWLQEIARKTDWVLPKMLADWNIVEGAPKRIGQKLEYSTNSDGSYSITTREYKKTSTNYQAANYDELLALFNSDGNMQAAKAIAGFIFAKATDTIQKTGLVKFQKLADGTFDVTIDGRELVEHEHNDVEPQDLDDVVGASLAESIRHGKGRSADGKQVTPFWLLKEAKRLRDVTGEGYMKDPQGTLAIAQRMDELAQRTLTAAGIDLDQDGNVKAASMPKGWKQIPSTKVYGALSGMIVRNEVYNDIVGDDRIGAYNGGGNAFKNTGRFLLGDDGLLWAAQRYWKMSKTSLNAPTHITNAVSNIGLLHLSGVPIHKLLPTLSMAVQSMLAFHKDPNANGIGKYVRIGKKYGFTAATFNNQELQRVNTELLDVLRNTGTGKHPVKQIQFLLGKLVNGAGDVYQMWEVIAKTAKLIDCMERENMPAARAALEAHIALYDYSDVSTSMKFIRQAPLGAAFATYTVKTTGMLLRQGKKDVVNIIKALRPGEGYKELGENRLLAGWASIAFSRKLVGYGMVMEFAAHALASLAGWDDDDYKKFKMVLPKFIREKNHVFIMPWKNENGDIQYMDISRFMPYDPVLSAAKHIAKGDLGQAIGGDLGFMNGPLTQLISVWTTGKDPFTKKDIVDKRSQPTAAEKLSQYSLYAWNMAMPSMFAMANDNTTEYAGSYGAFSKIGAAITGHVNPRTGAKIASPAEAAMSLVGLNARTINAPYQRAMNLKQHGTDIQGVLSDTRTGLKNLNLKDMPEEDRTKIVDERRTSALNKIGRIKKELDEYKEASDYRKSALYK